MVTHSNISEEITIGSQETQSIPFCDYAPHVFRYLRTQVFGVPDVDYLRSIRPSDSSKDIQALAKAKFSEGRSGYVLFLCVYISLDDFG